METGVVMVFVVLSIIAALIIGINQERDNPDHGTAGGGQKGLFMKTSILIVGGLLLSLFLLLWLSGLPGRSTAVATSPAVDPDTEALKAEIMHYTIEPCYLAVVRNGELTEFMTEKDALNLIKAASVENTAETTALALSLVKGKNTEQRMAIYEIGKKTCINALKGA